MKKLNFFYIILLSITPFSCNQNQIKVNSVKMDKLLIPILYDISYENYVSAASSTKDLIRKWELLKDMVDSAEKEYSDDFGTIPEYIGQKLKDMLETIEKEKQEESQFLFDDIALALYDWRTEHNTGYYLDDLFKFKYDVDIFTCIAEDKMLDLCDWEELEWQFEYLMSSFYFLNVYVSDLEYFDVEDDALRVKFTLMNDALMDLNGAMLTGQRNNVEREARRLQAHTLETIFLFGNCPESYAGI